MIVELMQGDCLELMRSIPDCSIDCVIADLPYGTTNARWDSKIPLPPLWRLFRRICKPDAAICLFGTEPFSSQLRISNPKMFRYDWIWQKSQGANFMNVKFQPYKVHEIVSVFSVKKHRYYPQMEQGEPYTKHNKSNGRAGELFNGVKPDCNIIKQSDGKRYPKSIQFFQSEKGRNTVHPTQKPVPLLEYLIKTYTIPGEVVLDCTMGSGSTGVAAVNTGRSFVGIELDAGYFEIAQSRIQSAQDAISGARVQG